MICPAFQPPVHGYRVLENPATGETYEFLETGVDTSGQLLRMRWTFAPGGRVPRHMHPSQREVFVVEQGEIEFRVGREAIIGRAGDRLSVPAGVFHSIRNRTDAHATAVVEKTPAGDSKAFYEATAGLGRDGRTIGPGIPRNPIEAAVFAEGFRDVIHLGFVPYPIQRIATFPLAKLGRKLGYRRSRDSYSSDIDWNVDR